MQTCDPEHGQPAELKFCRGVERRGVDRLLPLFPLLGRGEVERGAEDLGAENAMMVSAVRYRLLTQHCGRRSNRDHPSRVSVTVTRSPRESRVSAVAVVAGADRQFRVSALT